MNFKLCCEAGNFNLARVEGGKCSINLINLINPIFLEMKGQKYQAIGLKIEKTDLTELKAIAQHNGVSLNFVNRMAVKFFLTNGRDTFLKQNAPEIA